MCKNRSSHQNVKGVVTVIQVEMVMGEASEKSCKQSEPWYMASLYVCPFPRLPPQRQSSEGNVHEHLPVYWLQSQP